MNALEIAGACAEALEQQLESCGDGGLGQLQFANVGLIENDGAGDGKEFCAVGDAARRQDRPACEARSDGVDKSAAADAARLPRRR